MLWPIDHLAHNSPQIDLFTIWQKWLTLRFHLNDWAPWPFNPQFHPLTIWATNWPIHDLTQIMDSSFLPEWFDTVNFWPTISPIHDLTQVIDSSFLPKWFDPLTHNFNHWQFDPHIDSYELLSQPYESLRIHHDLFSTVEPLRNYDNYSSPFDPFTFAPYAWPLVVTYLTQSWFAPNAP